MTNLPASGSESAGFHLLDPRIQRWIWTSGWTELRDAQEQAIPLLLDGKQDVIIAATTASGKTEAAFFPILTSLAQIPNVLGLALYISPLKALINDQFRRLEELAELLEIPVTPWHGDINQQRKSRFMKKPGGCLLITPESLEALLARQGHSIRGLFAGLRYVVVDELHALMGTERGKQLQSLLNRVEQSIGRSVCRVGLSATLGDKQGAARFLRPAGTRPATTITSEQGDQQLLVLVKGVIEGVVQEPLTPQSRNTVKESVAKRIVADHLFQVLRGSSNLVFPNEPQRGRVLFRLPQTRVGKGGGPKRVLAPPRESFEGNSRRNRTCSQADRATGDGRLHFDPGVRNRHRSGQKRCSDWTSSFGSQPSSAPGAFRAT